MIPEKIRVTRILKGYSQEYMAFELDISQNAYSKLERGETELTVNRLVKIATILDVEISELLPSPKNSSPIDTSFLFQIINKIKSFFSGRNS